MIMDYEEKLTEYIKEKYGIVPEHPWISYPDYSTFKDRYSDKWFALIMHVDVEKLGLLDRNNDKGKIQNSKNSRREIVKAGKEEIPVVNVKADPDFITFINHMKGYTPAYHMSKKHWLTVLLDGSLPFEEVLNRVDESFELINNTPTRRIYEAVKKIPRGKVATYGQVAALAGEPKMARAVGNALHKNPDPDTIPCYRVVNSKGELAGEFAFGGEGAQAKLLMADGIEVVNGKVDLTKYGIEVVDERVDLSKQGIHV